MLHETEHQALKTSTNARDSSVACSVEIVSNQYRPIECDISSLKIAGKKVGIHVSGACDEK